MDREDYRIFLELLKKYKEQYGFKLYTFVLLLDHYHLLLELPSQSQEKYKGGISEIMHDLNSSYTKYFNGRYDRKGHLFQERFKAALIEKQPYLLKLTAYIHMNPQRLNLVSDAKEYPYSSYVFYLNKEVRLPELIKEEKDEILSLLSGQNYTEFVESIIKELDSELHKYLKKGILGTQDFQNKVRQAQALYQKEEKEEKRRLSFLEKLGIITVVVILVAASSTYILKFTLKARTKSINAPLFSEYQLPEQIQDLLKDLENTEWRIRLVPVSGGPVRSDDIRFYEGNFTSEDLTFKGYFPSDYSLVSDDNNMIVWKAVMQRGSQGTASWRGEILKGQMSGTLTIRQKGLESRDFSFVSVSRRKRKED